MKNNSNASLESIMRELEKIDRQFKDFVVVDKEWKDNSDTWKKEMEGKIKPIIRERNDYTILMKWWSKAFHFLAITIIFILSVDALIKVIISYMIRK